MADVVRVVDAEIAAEAAADPIMAVDLDASIVYANPAAREYLKDPSLIGTGLDSVLTVADGLALRSVLVSTPQRVLVEVTTDAGPLVEAEMSVNPFDGFDSRHWILVLHPLPRQELSMRELLRRATVDDLTSLSNRSYLLERVDATLRDPLTADVPHSLVVLGLDGFDHINDSYGHDAGDAVLVAIGARLRQLCRPGDLVARLGADQFAAWCRHVDENAVPGLVLRLASVFAVPVEFGELSLDVTGSLGATSTSFGRDPLELLRQADTSMYRARASGGDRCVIFDEVMAAEPEERRAREHELRRALSSEQFVLHFQPIVDLNTSDVVGMEALARWEHPRLGEIQPQDFMPLVDSALLRGELDTAMFEKACLQLAAWQDELDRPLSVWINVSAEQLSRSFVDDVSSLVLDLELTAERLVIEVAEGLANATPERVAVIESLRSLGVRIAVVGDLDTDDTHISYLGDLPIDVIKLDKEFVEAIAGRPERLALASSVIGFAHTLDIEVVAEGIETREDLQALHQLGCDHAQGQLLAWPLPAAEIPSINLDDVIDLR